MLKSRDAREGVPTPPPLMASVGPRPMRDGVRVADDDSSEWGVAAADRERRPCDGSVVPTPPALLLARCCCFCCVCCCRSAAASLAAAFSVARRCSSSSIAAFCSDKGRGRSPKMFRAISLMSRGYCCVGPVTKRLSRFSRALPTPSLSSLSS